VVGLVWSFWVRATTRDERGASVVEYALLLALIVVVCIAAMTLLGNSVGTRLSTTGNSLGTGS
jgi:pilus assembly protein Flp/PilA